MAPTTESSTSVISAQMRAAEGRELGRRTSFPVSASDIRRWAIAVYHPDPVPRLFWDAAAAAAGPHGGIVAPEDFNPFAWMDAGGPRTAEHDPNDADRTERSLGVPAPGLRYQLNGGLAVEYGVRMRPGDVITSVTRLGPYSERAGRLGQMLFTIIEDTWSNQDGALVKVGRLTLIRY